MKMIAQLLTLCCLISGCASLPPSAEDQAYSQTVGPFAATYDGITKDMRASLETGDTNGVIALTGNISAMGAFSLWAFYPTNGTFVATADRQFTEYLYTTYEADFTHWKRVMLFGSSSDKTIALGIMKSRARSLINGYPYSTEQNRIEVVGFACVVAMMSEYVLDDIVPLVKQNMSRWPATGQTVALCVLAHAGDTTAQDRLKAPISPTDRSVIGIYRTTSHTKQQWPNQASDATSEPAPGAASSAHQR
jgi:hypothetical protein